LIRFVAVIMISILASLFLEHTVVSVGSVCKTITFESLDAHPVYLQRLRVLFVHEGHRINVKVTGAKNVENPYSHNV